MIDRSDANILICPRRGKKEKQLPENGLLLVNPSEASTCHLRLKEAGGEARYLFNSGLTVAAVPPFFLAGPAIGAPMAALTMEKLIVLGGKRIILCGWCGAISNALRVGDIVLPTEAKSGEGTSRYYPMAVPAAPSVTLHSGLARVFRESDLTVHSGCVWSTDAVYREDRKMLHELHKIDRVAAVDMEFSALCSVASFRNIDFAAVLVVSDELWGEAWRPGFSSERFQKSRAKVLDVVLNNIGIFQG
jgi:uridine phosphorylase